MPHLTLEYSKNLGPDAQVAQLLGELHQLVGSAESVDIETVKSRMYGHEIYFVGANTAVRAFLHLRLEVLPGRTPLWKRELGTRIHAKMAGCAQSLLPATVNCSTTLEIKELAEEYFRTPAPPRKEI